MTGPPRVAPRQSAGAAHPPPAAVRYNHWPAVGAPQREAFAPARPVSVIVPCYQAPEALALTLAGLERQDWPAELLEVVVVDDGSEPPIDPPATPLDLRLIRQARDGFGLARARNAGARAAAHDILVFLDGDVMAEAGLIRAHARWHHALADALTVGFCAYVDVDGLDAAGVRAHQGSLADLLAGRASDPPWLERHMTRTADLTSRHPDLFRAVTGHNFGVSRALFEDAGGFDETFDRYGGEDTEFAYRVQVRGGLLVPERAAFGWHQGRWSDGRQAKERDMDRQAGKLTNLIAEPGFRPSRPARRFAVPRHVVTLDGANETPSGLTEAAAALLADPAGDLAVCIRAPAARGPARARLERRFARDPRFKVVPPGAAPGRAAPDRAAPGRAEPGKTAPRRGGPGRGASRNGPVSHQGTVSLEADALDAFPASPIHVTLPVAAVLRWSPAALPRKVALLASALGDAAQATADLEDGTQLCVTRAWALNRARRAGGRAADYGDRHSLPARWFEPGRTPAPLRPRIRRWLRSRLRRAWSTRTRRRRGLAAVVARVWAEARHVRGPRTAWRLVQWLAAAARWRLRESGPWTATPVPPATPPGAAPDPPLGVTLAALGPRSRAVFAASSRVLRTACAQPLDAALADDAAAGKGESAPLARLDAFPALAVPALDPARDNPVGWVRDVEPRVLTLGPPRRLGNGSRPPRARVRAAASPDDLGALRHCHHVEDVAAFHAGPIERAGTLARLAACGVPVRLADRDPALAPVLGTALHELMTCGIRDAAAHEREACSIAQRREALRTHSLHARARQVCEAAGANPPPWPRVSVLLATRRPALLAHAVAGVARQRFPRLQLVLALHGPGFDPDAVEAALTGFAHPVKVLRIDAAKPLGAVLGTAAAAATGALLAKMDDDDVYGPEHLWDLVLAHGYSGAMLVGRFPATVYLASRDRTVRQRAVPSETWSRSITGGTMLIARADLRRAGGWRAVPRHVDEALVEDVLRIGGGVYRTHDRGYLLVRHGRAHTWRRDAGGFLAGAEASEPGWRPELAGLGDLPASACRRLAQALDRTGHAGSA